MITLWKLELPYQLKKEMDKPMHISFISLAMPRLQFQLHVYKITLNSIKEKKVCNTFVNLSSLKNLK